MSASVPERPNFEIGAHYVRKELHDQFRGNRQKGISAPADEDFVFIFTGPSGEEYGYDDELLDDGMLIYFGEGRVGDMEFTDNNGNTKIRDHRDRGLDLYVFEETSEDGVMSYVGEYEYESHDWTDAPDGRGNKRRAIRFRLVPADRGGISVGPEGIDGASEMDLFIAARQNPESPSPEGIPSPPSGGDETYTRSELTKQFALRSADGVCQGCGEDAPFVDKHGDPFLEVHHLHRLSDGGPDNPENVVALCPNCHRRRHRGRDGDDFNQRLIRKANERNRRLLDAIGG
jgi:5-methylcytosine-specific restriction protein A